MTTRLCRFILAFPLILLASTALAADGSIVAWGNDEYGVVSGAPVGTAAGSRILVGGVPGGTAAKVDTTYLLGGPGTYTGRFENAAGQPDWQGWISRDLSAPEANHWHVDTYNCANLDSLTFPNHVWWCGRTYPFECGGDSTGYGPGWYDSITWQGAVAIPDSNVIVIVTADLNHDLEPGYDYLQLAWQGADSAWTVVRYWTGTGSGVAVADTFAIPAGDLMGEGDQVLLAWIVQTDGGWDDVDCLYSSTGAAQVDNITVSFDQGGGAVWGMRGVPRAVPSSRPRAPRGAEACRTPAGGGPGPTGTRGSDSTRRDRGHRGRG